MYYVIQNSSILISENKQALSNYYNGVKLLPLDYEPDKYIVENNELVLNSNFEAQQKQKEKERIAMLSLTRGDVFRGLLMAKQVTRAQIRAMIENNELLTMLQKEMALIDFDEALNFYRGNELIDTIGLTLGITSEQLDLFFEDGNYEHLLPKEEPTETPSEVPTETPVEETISEELVNEVE